VELGWLVRGRDTRAVRVTLAGRTGMRETFGLDLSQLETPQPLPLHSRITPTAGASHDGHTTVEH
jgi:hypothetical protein